MDKQVQNELRVILRKISNEYSSVELNSSTLQMKIFGSKNAVEPSRTNCVHIDFVRGDFRIDYDWGDKYTQSFRMSDFPKLTWKDKSLFWQSGMRKGEYFVDGVQVGNYGQKFNSRVRPVLLKIKNDVIPAQQEIIENIKKLKAIEEKERLRKLSVSQNTVLSELDKDGNGEVDVIEGNDFNLLLKKHQSSIINIDRNYIQQFVKVATYLKTKKENIQTIFDSIKDTPNEGVLKEYVEILKDEIHTYNLVLFNSLNMVVALIKDDMITFYEIYEMFDSINMFDSKHEKDVSQRLVQIGDGIQSLMREIRVVGNKITQSLAALSYVTEESNRQLTEQLTEINSSIQTNNLLTGIQAYQLYKSNRKT